MRSYLTWMLNNIATQYSYVDTVDKTIKPYNETTILGVGPRHEPMVIVRTHPPAHHLLYALCISYMLRATPHNASQCGIVSARTRTVNIPYASRGAAI